MHKEKAIVFTLRLGGTLGMAVLFAASPFSVRVEQGLTLPSLTVPAALASNSGSGGGGGNSGSGGGNDDDDHDDDHGGGHDDDDDDDDDDDSSDDGSSTGDGTSSGTVGDGATVVKLEVSASGIEVTYSDGSREEIENGRYEAKDSSGRTIVERAATQADIDRLNALR
jgi:hypothetical protein